MSDPKPTEPPTKEQLKGAIKAFKKRLKLTRLDQESQLSRNPVTTGRPSDIVAITPPEAFRLADAVRGGRAAGMTADTVRARGAPLVGIGPAERIGRKLACPLLVDGACSVYRHRPLACRQATSLDLAACVDEFEGRNLMGRIPISGAYLNHASNAHITLLGAMRAAKLPTDSFELAGALDVALTMADGEARWLGGEDVFRNVQKPGPREAQTERAIQVVADGLSG